MVALGVEILAPFAQPGANLLYCVSGLIVDYGGFFGRTIFRPDDVQEITDIFSSVKNSDGNKSRGLASLRLRNTHISI